LRYPAIFNKLRILVWATKQKINVLV